VDAARSSAEENESCRPEGRVKVEHVLLRKGVGEVGGGDARSDFVWGPSKKGVEGRNAVGI